MGVHINQLPQEVKDRLGLKDTAYKQFWAVFPGKEPIFFRSSWEFYYAVFLENLKRTGKIKDWFHEPKCFWFEKIKRGVRSYLPDFLVIHLTDSQEYVETKGYYDSKSQTKMKRMAKYYPDVNIRLVGSDWFYSNIKSLKAMAKNMGIVTYANKNNA